MDMSDSPAKGRSFCKIMFSEISLHDKMMIPDKFVRKYGKDFHFHIYLKAPRGAVWHVDLVRDADKVWLQNGWPEFSRFYSLSFGHFLVFKYQGNSHFDVFIYDIRGIEIDYPLGNTVIDIDEQGNLNVVGERVMSDIDELKVCKKTRVNYACTEACHIGKCPMRKLQPKKSAEVTTFDKKFIELLDDSIQEGGGSATLALAKGFKCDNPSFILTVLPSFIDRRSQVDIKRAFAQRYMRSKNNFEVRLQVERRTWPVMCFSYRNRCRFGKGWVHFADSNSLSIGDVCVFELVNRAKMLLNVFIFRAA